MNDQDRDDFLKRPTLDLKGGHKKKRLEIAGRWSAEKDEAAVESLATVAGNARDDSDIRIAAIWAMGSIGSDQAVVSLKTLLTDRLVGDVAAKALSQIDQDEAAANRAFARLSAGEYEQGAKELVGILARRPKHVATYYGFVVNPGCTEIESLSRQRRIADALRMTKAIAEPLQCISPEHPEASRVANAYALLVVSTEQMRNEYPSVEALDATIPLLERAVQLDSSKPKYRLYLATLLSNKGRALGRAGRFQEAIAVAKKAVDVDPTFADGWLTLAAQYGELRKKEEMMRCLEQAADFGNQQAISQLREWGLR